MFKAGQLVRHYKGRLYAILAVAEDTEAPDSYSVTYFDIYKKDAHKRDLPMFSEVLPGGIPRFTIVDTVDINIHDGVYYIKRRLEQVSPYLYPNTYPGVVVVNTETGERSFLHHISEHGNWASIIPLHTLHNDNPTPEPVDTIELVQKYVVSTQYDIHKIAGMWMKLGNFGFGQPIDYLSPNKG